MNFTPALEQAKSSLSQIKTKRALTRVGVSLSQMTFSRPPLKRVYSSKRIWSSDISRVRSKIKAYFRGIKLVNDLHKINMNVRM